MNTEEPQKRSTFVTVIAWIFIVLTGFGTFITALQNVMVRIMFDDEIKGQMKAAQTESGMEMPSFFTTMFDNFELIFLAFFIFNLIALICSIGLLKRKNWARIIIICIMGVGIAWNIGGIYFQKSMMSQMQEMQTSMIEEAESRKTEQQVATQIDEECCENDPCCDQETTDEEREEQRQNLERMNKEMEQMQNIIMWVTYFFAFFISLIQAFIIWKLCNPKIVMEFKNT